MVGDMDDSPRDVACGYTIVIGKCEACLLLTSLVSMLAALSVYALWLRARSRVVCAVFAVPLILREKARPYARGGMGAKSQKLQNTRGACRGSRAGSPSQTCRGSHRALTPPDSTAAGRDSTAAEPGCRSGFIPTNTLAPVLPSLGLCLGVRGYCSQRIRV